MRTKTVIICTTVFVFLFLFFSMFYDVNKDYIYMGDAKGYTRESLLEMLKKHKEEMESINKIVALRLKDSDPDNNGIIYSIIGVLCNKPKRNRKGVNYDKIQKI